MVNYLLCMLVGLLKSAVYRTKILEFLLYQMLTVGLGSFQSFVHLVFRSICEQNIFLVQLRNVIYCIRVEGSGFLLTSESKPHRSISSQHRLLDIFPGDFTLLSELLTLL